MGGPPDSPISAGAISAHWLAWVHANLGNDPVASDIAAGAAIAAMLRGDGIRSASAAATNAWLHDGKGTAVPFLSFWRLLLEDPRKPFVAASLARHGVLVPGNLVDVRVTHDRNDELYTATYEYEWNGSSHTVVRRGDTPEDVFVFLDPREPERAMVLSNPFTY